MVLLRYMSDQFWDAYIYNKYFIGFEEFTNIMGIQRFFLNIQNNPIFVPIYEMVDFFSFTHRFFFI